MSRINELVEEEHRLRTQVRSGVVSTEEERSRLRALEDALDQCWDLLLRRRAARDAGQDPETATARSVEDVEKYLQ